MAPLTSPSAPRYPRTVRLPLPVLALIVISGCRTGDPSGGVESWDRSAASALPIEVAEAVRAARDARADRAEEILIAGGGVSVDAPERSWLLLDLWLSRCATARARSVTRALPHGAMADVLRAHALRDPDERLALVRRALAGPAAGWAHLESALALSEQGGHLAATLSHAARAYALGPDYVRLESLEVSAHVALEADKGEVALAFARRAAALDPGDPRAPLLASRVASRLGRIPEATLDALTALHLQPKGARIARRLADLVREGPGVDVERRAREAVVSMAMRPDTSAEVLAVHGLLAERAGASDKAVRAYERALAAGCDPVPVDRHLRRLLFARGRRREAIALLRRAVPPARLLDAENLEAPRWRALDAAAAAVPDGAVPAARFDAIASLAEALVGVGALEDAAIVARDDPSPRGVALRRRLEVESRFEAAVREAVEEGYRAPAAGKKPRTASALLARLRELAHDMLPPEEAADFDDPERGGRSVPLLGFWLDHGAETTSPVVAHFRRYGRYLVFGERAGKPPEAVLLSLAFLASKTVILTQGRAFRHDLAVGYDREIRSYLDFQGGVLSGAALPDGVWLDADAARREDAGLRAALRVDAALLTRVLRAGDNPPAPDGVLGTLAMDDTAGVSFRLARRYLSRVGADPWGAFDVLRAHESGHVLDLARHFPIAKGLPRTAALLASEGFAFGRVEAHLEGRAQLAAVRDARDPDLALLDLLRPLPLYERSPEAHERGYRDVVARFLRILAEHPTRWPRLDRTKKLLPQLDRLTPEEIRDLGNAAAE